MTNEECIKALELLKDKLIDNLAIYHERVTLLIQLTQFEIGEKRVEFKAKIIKPLHKSHANNNRLYNHMMAKEEIFFSSSYQFGPNGSMPLINGNIIGRVYSPFTLWLDPELTEFVRKNDDEMTENIPKYILWNDDWTVLKNID